MSVEINSNMKINDPFLITQHGGNDACGDKFRHSATSATCHFRVISLLQQNITKPPPYNRSVLN